MAPSVLLEKCPAFPIGLMVTDDEYVATSFSEPLSESNEAIEIAFSQAKIESRILLVNRVNTPGLDSRKILGAIQVQGCRDSKFVYITTKISKRSISQSRRLRDAIGESVRINPSPKLD